MSWKYFKLEEFACRCGCGENAIVPAFVDKLDSLRDKCGFPLHINSGYRCPKHNAKISETGRDGPHTKGRAADIEAYGNRTYEILRHVHDCGFTGIGLLQKGPSRYVHLDDLTDYPRPNVWTY